MASKKGGSVKKAVPGMWLVKHLVIAFVIVVILIIGAVILLNTVTRHGEELSVPDLSNLTVAEAQAKAAEEGMRVEVTDSVFVKRMKRGTVFRQNPSPGGKVKNGRRILLTINAVNPKEITMPDLVGFSLRQAKTELSSRGLVLGKLIYVHDMATNNVLRQLNGNREAEAGEMIESESVIDLVLGLNSMDSETYAPYLHGLKYLSAVEAVHDHSLNIGEIRFDSTVKTYDDSLNAVVYCQIPDQIDSVSLRMGDEVALYLTLDESKVPVREVVEELMPEENNQL